MNLSADEFEGSWYLHDSHTERFWRISGQGEALTLDLITDDALIARLREEFYTPPTAIMPDEPGN